MRHPAAPAATIRTAIVIFPGVEELDFLGPREVLLAARGCGAGFAVSLVSMEKDPVVAAHGLGVTPVEPLDPAAAWDLIVVPGGSWLAGEATGVRRALREGVLPRWLRDCHGRGSIVASVCTGAFLLGAAGLLDGRRATTHHRARHDLAARHPVEVVAERVVDEGPVLTAGGITAGIDLALHLVERLAGKEAATRTAQLLEYPPENPGLSARPRSS